MMRMRDVSNPSGTHAARTSRRRLLAFTSAAGATGALGIAAAGCGIGQPSAQNQAPVTLRVLLDPNLITLFGETAPMIPTFQSANPNIKLDIEAGPPPAEGPQARYAKFRAKIAAGDAVDVFGLVPSDAVPSFGKPGQVRDCRPCWRNRRRWWRRTTGPRSWAP
jgi:ABC-type glycerol-3-phosphate transport system substrate-binding protein